MLDTVPGYGTLRVEVGTMAKGLRNGTGGIAVKNLCAKTRPKDNPYEVWQGGGWTWAVLKKWQVDDAKPYARWFCFVTSPVCPEGELGDVYVADIVKYATCVQVERAKVAG